MAPGNALTPQLIALCPGNVVRRYGFQLPAHAESVGRARQLTRDRLAHWDLDEPTRETAVLVVSELVTNAVVHAAGHRVVCELREGEGHLRIAVEDQGYGPTGPQLHHTGVDESEGEGGRGLFLVDSLCSGWGAHDTSGYGPGRVVWAELPHGGRAGTGDAHPGTPVYGVSHGTNGVPHGGNGVSRGSNGASRGSGTPC